MVIDRENRCDRNVLRLVRVSFALAIVWTAVAWLIAGTIVRERSARLVEHEEGAVAAKATSVGANIGFALAHLRSIPQVIARQPNIEQVLSRFGPAAKPSGLPPEKLRRQFLADPELAGLAQRLESILEALDVDQIWVINAAGDCIASGGFPPGSTTTGTNYADREYFRAARESGAGKQFAVGRTTNTPGIFYSAPVFVANRFLGVVGVKIDVARLSRLITDSNVFVNDENGVVIISSDGSYNMKTVPGTTVGRLKESDLDNRYKRRHFDALEMQPTIINGVTLTTLSGHDRPVLVKYSESQADILKTWAFREMPELARIRNDGVWIFLLLVITGVSIIGGIMAAWVYFCRSRKHRIEIDNINNELVKLNQELSVQARFDALTGCANRRHFLAELDGELKRATRFELPCALAILDIDHFKEVNDQHGHAAGDALLKHFAQTVAKCLRSTDLLGRIGGEEFAVLLPQTDIVGAKELAERICRTVEQSPAMSGTVALRCTASIGVTQWVCETDSVESLLARADNAMYAAKHGGRNRVSTAP